MFEKSAAIFIAGNMFSGKSTCAKMLMDLIGEQNLTGAITPLAFPIKCIATKYMGWDGKKDEKGRKLLQVIGTGCGRIYNPDCWVSYLVDKYIPSLPVYPLDFVIIDDWRFPNERDYIKNNPLYEVYTIKLYREGNHSDTHPSENSLPPETNYYDYFINNNYDLNYLQNETKLIFENILEKHPKY
jgi:hypothetical protein